MAQLIPNYRSTSGLSWNNSNTLTLNKPAGTVENDLMIAQVAYNTSQNPTSEPTGWTRFQIYTPINEEMALYWKIAGPSEPASYSWTFALAATDCGGGISRYDQVDTVDPILWHSFNTGQSNTMLYPGQTGLTGNFRVFGFGYHNDAIPTYSIDQYGGSSPNSVLGLCAGRQTLPTSGDITSISQNVGSSGYWMASRVVLRGFTEVEGNAIMMGSVF